MASARFRCTAKSGTETFTAHLEPVLDDVCPVCGQITSKDFCLGDPRSPHEETAVPNGDRSFFKDLPHATIDLSVLTPEAAAQFEPGRVTKVTFELESEARV